MLVRSYFYNVTESHRSLDSHSAYDLEFSVIAKWRWYEEQRFFKATNHGTQGI